jgi:hypothetical protein
MTHLLEHILALRQCQGAMHKVPIFWGSVPVTPTGKFLSSRTSFYCPYFNGGQTNFC